MRYAAWRSHATRKEGSGAKTSSLLSEAKGRESANQSDGLDSRFNNTPHHPARAAWARGSVKSSARIYLLSTVEGYSYQD